MDLRDYLRVLRKGWALILAFLIVGTALGALLTLATKKVYESSVQLFVYTQSEGNAQLAQQGQTYAASLVQSITSGANSPAVVNPIVRQFPQYHLTESELAGKISADAPLNKTLVNLHVTDNDPVRATRLANALSTQYIRFIESTTQTGGGAQNLVRLSVYHPAAVPGGPIKPNKILNIGLGLVVGLLVGIGVAVLREVLDNTVKGPEDFEELGLPVLGLVPFDKRTPKNPVAFRSDPHSSRSEAYRQLRTNMQFVNVDHAPRIIAITSAVPGEGKSTTAINLAAALAEAGYRVCLVEADLRRPTLAGVLGLSSDVGFTTALIGKAPVEAVLQNAGRNLAVLTCGPVPPNPSELLITDQAGAIIRHIAEKVDFTIIDTAPLLPVADGAEVASLADATLIVHHAGKSTKDQAVRSVEALAKVGERPVGVILNMMTRNRGNYDYGYGYYYTYRPDRSRSKSKDETGRPLDVASLDPSPAGAAAAAAAPLATASATLPDPQFTDPQITDPQITDPAPAEPVAADPILDPPAAAHAVEESPAEESPAGEVTPTEGPTPELADEQADELDATTAEPVADGAPTTDEATSDEAPTELTAPLAHVIDEPLAEDYYPSASGAHAAPEDETDLLGIPLLDESDGRPPLFEDEPSEPGESDGSDEPDDPTDGGRRRSVSWRRSR